MRIPVAVALAACLVVAQDAPSRRIPEQPVLAYLLQSRLASGAWPGASAEADTGATAEALLAFLSAGYTERAKDPHGAAVRGALDFLVKGQHSAGALSADAEDHALGTLALCEHWSTSRDPGRKNPAQLAVLDLLSRQRVDGSFGDLDATAWAGMALASAKSGGLGVDDKAVERLLAWLKGSHVAAPREAAIALLLRPLLGKEDPRAEALASLAAVCLALPPTAADADATYTLFATYALFKRGGADWRKWNDSLKAVLVSRKPDGSFDPGAAESDGRVGATALREMCGTVYFRYDRTRARAAASRVS